MPDTNNEEGRWLEGLDERTEQERMVEFHAEELPDFWTWLRDQKLPMEGDTISLRRVESLVHQAWVAGAALSFRPPVPAESSEGVWTCGHCGRSSEAHGMPEHPAYQCVYAPVWKPLDPVTPQVTSDPEPTDALLVDAVGVMAFQGYGSEKGIEVFKRMFTTLSVSNALASRPSVEGEREATRPLQHEMDVAWDWADELLEWLNIEDTNPPSLSEGIADRLIAAGFSIPRKETKQ